MTKFIFLSVSEAIINPVRMIQSILLEEKDRKMLREIFRYSISEHANADAKDGRAVNGVNSIALSYGAW